MYIFRYTEYYNDSSPRTDDVSDEGLRLGAAEVAVERGNDLFLVREDTLAESHQLGLWRRVAIGGDRW